MMEWKACIFDLDGVIVHTSHFHFLAWRRLADSFGYKLTEEENDQLKGLSRLESLQAIMKMADVELSESQQASLMTSKNDWYLEYAHTLKPSDALTGVREFILELRSVGIGVGLGSASKNAALILELLEMTPLFDVRVDGTHTTRSKPDPQVFMMGAEALKVDPKEALVFEDSVAGIQAANAAGFYSIGIGDEVILNEANLVLPGFEGVAIKELKEKIG